MPNDPAIFPKQAMYFKGQNPVTFAFQIMGAGICEVTVDLSSDESLRQDNYESARPRLFCSCLGHTHLPSYGPRFIQG